MTVVYDLANVLAVVKTTVGLLSHKVELLSSSKIKMFCGYCGLDVDFVTST